MEKLAGFLPLAGILSGVLWAGLAVAQSSPAGTIVSVAALGVQSDGLVGFVNYILIQLNRTESQEGPTVQFNEIKVGGGSAVGEEWKEGMQRAVRAATRAVGVDGHDWLITLKNRSLTAITDGTSASAAVAVGIMAAYFGDSIGDDIALSGQITPDARLDVVGGLPQKIEAAAAAHYRAIVIPRDQIHMPDWAATNDAATRAGVRLIPAGTLNEAYQVMTGKNR
jgi:hypothetical protein